MLKNFLKVSSFIRGRNFSFKLCLKEMELKKVYVH